MTTLNLKVRQTDVARGLIMVEGAVPGGKGGWITVRDAVKKQLPDGVPKPGKFKLAEAATAAENAPAPQAADTDRARPLDRAAGAAGHSAQPAPAPADPADRG